MPNSDNDRYSIWLYLYLRAIINLTVDSIKSRLTYTRLDSTSTGYFILEFNLIQF